VSARRALLVIDRGGDEPEALELAESAGYRISGIVPVRRIGDGRVGISAGKAGEVAELARSSDVDAVIVYGQLNSSQAFNLMRDSGVGVVDRDKLILEIFALRAGTPEAKLQVKLAELTYEIPRLKELIRRVKMGEQPGLYGYGEYEVEKYYDHVRKLRMRILEELRRYSRHRDLQRRGRSRWGMPIISLAGYTGAGKTTLFNALSKERKPVTGRAFTTLTTTTREMWLGDGEYALLTDTVGFLSGLPHYMIEAFKSTLEELGYADVVLLVVDAAEEPEVVARKYGTSIEILQELSVEPSRIVNVFNKADLVDGGRIAGLADRLGARDYVAISARDRAGLGDLRREILRVLGRGPAEARASPEAGAEPDGARPISDRGAR